MDIKTDSKKRVCLYCLKEFNSKHKYNRICNPCKPVVTEYLDIYSISFGQTLTYKINKKLN